MLHSQTLPRRSWAGIGWLATIFLSLLVGLANIYVGMFLVALAMLGITAMLLMSPRAVSAARTRTAPASFVRPSGAQWIIYTAEGDPRAAIVVPVDGVEGYTAVLTTEGYKLVNDAGQIVYALK